MYTNACQLEAGNLVVDTRKLALSTASRGSLQTVTD